MNLRLTRRHRPERVDWTGWAPPGPELRSIRGLFRRHRRAAVGAYLLIVLVGAYGFWTAETQRAELKRQADSIQAERARSIRATCETDKTKNARAKAKIVRLFPAGPAREITSELVDALVPVEDCDAQVRERVATR